MGDIDHSPLGREVAYPRHYDATLLYPIPRRLGREAIGVAAPLPFIGHDQMCIRDRPSSKRRLRAAFALPGDPRSPRSSVIRRACGIMAT